MLSKHLPLPKVTEATFRIRDITIHAGTAGKQITLATETTSLSPEYWRVELSYIDYGDYKDRIQVLVSFFSSGPQFKGSNDPLMPRDIDLSLYRSMHLVPLTDVTKAVSVRVAPSVLVAGKCVAGYILQESVRTSRKALTSSFDIVFSTEDTMARTPYNSPVPPIPPSPPVKNQEILPFLLKDPHSVDVCFVFPNESKYSGYGLWAHRLVLRQNKVFAKMVDDAVRQAADTASKVQTAPVSPTATNSTDSGTTASTWNQPHAAYDDRSTGELSIQDDDRSSTSSFVDADNQDGSANETEAIAPTVKAAATTVTGAESSAAPAGLTTLAPTPTSSPTPATVTSDKKREASTLTLVIEKHSLATFCSLLRFVYTGQIDYSNRFSDFVLSVSNTPTPNLHSSSSPSFQSRDSPSTRWTSLPDENNVWTTSKEEHLMLCAHEYGVDDLAASCQVRMEFLMTEANIGHYLFDIVPVYPKIKAHTIEYVIRNKVMLFAPGKDLFERYRGYPQCHSVMMEIFQLMALSK
ncbi:hypothetical protein BGW39_007839 [Mortierella sp. 14UC]|nr:hypothetical protein BGW39_007839 [Mortierella sp. 14UC]